MADFKPNTPYNVPCFLLTASETRVKGVLTKTYTKSATPFFASVRTFGGTEKVVNDVIVLEDTATIETWYDPNITSNCRVEINSQQYEILGTPENINMRNQYLVFKVRAIKGGA